MSSPEISFRFYESEVPSQEQEKVNSSISKPTETGGAINYARCARVLRRLDSCPGVITASNMSTTQNSATASSICNTREPSWAEDFIDLSEFCQPSTIPTKMEDLVDEHVTSPISSTVRDHGLDFALEVNDRFDNNIGDNLWCIDSPLTLQEELCDPISDWLSTTKETNVYDNLSTRSQLYNINDTLLSPTFTQVPTKNPQHNYGRLEEVDFADNKMPSPPVQPDTTFFHTDSTTVSMFNDCGSRNPTLSQNLFNKPENSLHLTNSSLFADKTTTDTYAFPSQNVRYFDAKKPPDVPALSRVTVDTSVSSPCSVQSPSITQSNLNQEEKTNASGITTRRNVKLKLKVDEPPSAASSCTMDTPEMLQPLVNKNSEFDLVSYVFDDSNKAPMSFDISNLQNSSSNTVRDTTVKTTPLRIKSEPKEDPYAEEETSSNSKRSYDGEERYYPSKRSRKFSNTSSLDLEDLTQLESEKYRELRNRNNEASRRSRANRKNREVEMREHAAHLEAENRRLKVKAEEMEQLVKRLRNCLMQLVLKRR